jgi:cytochrome b
MEGEDEELTELGLAHDTGRLCWGMWVCDCARCRALCRQSPDVLLVIKGSNERRIVTAGMVADAGADELLEEGYVREVFVAQEQPRRRGSRRRAP